MIAFGKPTNGRSAAPFLVKTLEGQDHELKFVVAMPACGEKGAAANENDATPIREILSGATPVYADENELYEIIFDQYVFHMTRNESYTAWDEYELRQGDCFVVFDRSRLLDFLPQIVQMGIVEAFCPQGYSHYGIYCQNHIIDVIAAKEPKVKKV